MKIAIIGGGAAGMMCAVTICEQMPKARIFLIEKNEELGKKVILSGGGRCNVTTGITDLKTVLQCYPRGEKFLISSMHRFSPTDVYQWFLDHGVPLKCEEDLRVFPQSDDGKDIVKTFEQIFANGKVKILTKHSVTKIEKTASPTPGFIVNFKEQSSLIVDKVVMALGGQAYRHTGSTGDGYTIAESFGHTITPLAPSLNSFITKEKWPRQLSGLSFTRATIHAGRTKMHQRTGPFLFTHHGISGPTVFALSSLVAFEEYSLKNPLPIFIDLVPDVTSETLFKELRKYTELNPKRNFKTTLHQYIPRSLAEMLGKEFNLTLEKTNAAVNNAELHSAIKILKRLPLQAVLRGAGDEFVTAGGVNLAEINPQTLESTLCPGLYFTGEILAIDGFTGGFNLQAAWATGRAAGESIAKGK
jgi:hypothetical protein